MGGGGFATTLLFASRRMFAAQCGKFSLGYISTYDRHYQSSVPHCSPRQ